MSTCSKYYESGGFTYEIFTKLYDTLVQPITLYGSAIWGMYEQKRLNVIQNRACKFFLGLNRNSSNVAARGDMGWSAPVTRQRMDVFRLLQRLKSMPCNRLPHAIHLWSKRRGNSWERNIDKLAKKLKLCDLVSTPAVNMTCVRKRLRQIDETTWFTDMWDDHGNPNGNKLRTYRLMKKDLKPESYVVLKSIPRKAKKICSLLRSGSLQINIEKLRYSRPPVPLSERYCPFCPDKVESESHFVCDCDIYSDLRYDLFQEMERNSQNFHTSSPQDKMCLMFNTPEIAYMLCTTLLSMFDRRQSLVLSS